MPENPNYQNPPQYQPTPEDGELDEATLDRVVGGLVSPNQAQESQMSFNLQYLQLQSQMQSENSFLTNEGSLISAPRQLTSVIYQKIELSSLIPNI